MNSSQQQKKWIRAAWRLSAVAAAAAVLLALPVDWGQMSRRAALLAVSLRQPQNAAALLNGQLTDTRLPTQTVDPPAAATGGDREPNTPADSPDNKEDTTGIDLPAAGPVTPATPPIQMIAPPGEKGNGGKVIEQKMDTGDTLHTGIAIQNRSGTAVDIAAALKRDLSVAWEETDAPQVLILHTHTTEGYMTYDAGYYNDGDRNRTEDHTRNVCAVGEAVRLALAQAGITAIHDTTVHDSPVYSGAYTRSAKTAQAYLDKYPTIRVVLDLHRDAVMQGDTNIVKPTATVEGKKAAQMMLITGVVSTTALPHPNWQQNLTLAARWQKALCDLSPDLMRPLNTVASRYNQHLSPGWVLVEVGSEGNTVEEAVYSGQLLARTLAELLKG